MRSLALLLLLLNITFFTWQQSQLPWLPWQPEQFKPTLPVIPPERTDLLQLQLVGESSLEKVAATSLEKEQSSTAAVEKTPVKEETKVAKADEPEEMKTTLSSDSQQTKIAPKTEPEKVEAAKEEKPAVQKDEAKTKDTTEVTQQEIKLTCAEIGPYAQQAAAEKGAKWFQIQHKDIKTHVKSQAVPIVTQTKVYLADFENKQAAQLAQQRLTQQGITDHAMFTTPKSEIAISLGVYSNEANAENRVKQLKEKGYPNVKMEKQQKNDTKYWLNVKIPANRKEVLGAFKKAFKSVSTLKEVACE